MVLSNYRSNSGRRDNTLPIVFAALLFVALVAPCASAVAGTSKCVCPVTAGPCSVNNLVADTGFTCTNTLSADGALNENVQVNANAQVTALNFTGLKTVNGYLWVEGNTALASISMPDLVSVGRYLKVVTHTGGGAVLADVAAPKLVSTGEQFHLESNSELTKLNFSVQNRRGDFIINGLTNAQMTEIVFESLKTVGGKFDVQLMNSLLQMRFGRRTVTSEFNARGNGKLANFTFPSPNQRRDIAVWTTTGSCLTRRSRPSTPLGAS